MSLPERIAITEVGPRDGLQNEDRFVETAQKVEFIERLARTGLRRVEAVSFVHPRAIPQMRDSMEVMSAVERRPEVTYIGLVPNEVGARRALEAGMDELATVVSASESHNRQNVRRSIDESLEEIRRVAALAGEAGRPWAGYVSTAFGCPYEGDVPVSRVTGIAAELRSFGAEAIALGDTIGIANPRQVIEVVRAFRAALPGVPLRLHFHDTRGAGMANALAALQEGVDRFDGSVAGLGGCPYAPGAAGNLATEDLVHMAQAMGIETGVDLERLIEVARWAEELAGRALPGRVKQAGAFVAAGVPDEGGN